MTIAGLPAASGRSIGSRAQATAIGASGVRKTRESGCIGGPGSSERASVGVAAAGQ